MTTITIMDVPEEYVDIVRIILATEVDRDAKWFGKMAANITDTNRAASYRARSAVMGAVAKQLKNEGLEQIGAKSERQTS